MTLQCESISPETHVLCKLERGHGRHQGHDAAGNQVHWWNSKGAETMNHEIYLHHRRVDSAKAGVPYPADSTVEISVDTTDLIEAWAELFSRMPNDLYAAAKAAMEYRR